MAEYALLRCPRFVFFLVLLLLLTVFTRHSSCSRPLRKQPGGSDLNNGGAAAAAAVQTIALPTAAMSRVEEEVVPSDRRVEVLLDKKPRGRPPPSAPSKRTNDINS